MTQDQDRLDHAAIDAFGGDLRFVLNTVTDGDGFGIPEADVDRWTVDVRMPVHADDDDERTVSVGTVVLSTVRQPEDLLDLEGALGTGDAAAALTEALAREDDDGRTFAHRFQAAASVSGQVDLLVVDHVQVREPFGTVPELVGLVVAGLRQGPAGRSSAFVVADPSDWEVSGARTTHGRPRGAVARGGAAAQQLLRAGFAAWAGTAVLVFSNVDPDAAFDRAARSIMELPDLSDLPDRDDAEPRMPFPVGTRSGDLWLEHLVDQAVTQPSVPVRMDLPAGLDPSLQAGVPDDVHWVDADETTGQITVHTHDEALEVVGAAGNAPQLVGDATTASAATQAWLREVHRRYLAYWPGLHEQIHERVEELLEGTLDPVDDEDTPHLHVPDLPRMVAEWPGDGVLELDVVDTDADPQVFEAVLVRGDDHEHVGGVLVHDSGHVQGFLHDEWTGDVADDAAVQCIVTLGADEYIAGVLHEYLEDGVTDVLLTGEVPEHCGAGAASGRAGLRPDQPGPRCSAGVTTP